ncbi:PREDICTED: leucine-rich repeat-containing protein 38 [Nanorana parkeri]|uniref:leucine-rich repeat-containing protein 38 n=1 Tax=Nanorana parkeri TaxID=125878 RepID=UPI0008550312|nr:PREDICTED: leucine-rich repeat-containing protein 38 [Nanorana parkeri]
MLPCFLCYISPLFCVCLLIMLPLSLLCPSVCICLDYHTIDCRDQGLPSLPNLFPLDIRKLLAANNHIQSIPADLFLFYADLVYLDLRNNSLTSLEEGTFSTSTRLVFLDLSYNNLTQLEAGIFKSADRLIKLSLGNNNLSEVHEDAFENLDALQVLELNDNNFQSISVAVLESLPSLRTVRLEGNPWLCDCEFANLFFWIDENSNKLQKGVEEIQCILEDRKVFLHELSDISFSECKFSLSLTDFLIIIFSGVAVSIAAIFSSFFLATTVHCFHKCAPSKDEDDDDDEK